jgi:protein farnesyltransferase/geranylgeranyltransferase type-1 subunit alpha
LKVLSAEANHVFALSTLLDLLSHGFQANQEFRDAVDSLRPSNSDPADSDLAKTICSILRHVDPMRVNYWTWRKSKLPSTVSV